MAFVPEKPISQKNKTALYNVKPFFDIFDIEGNSLF